MGRLKYKIIMCLLWCLLVEYSGSQMPGSGPIANEKYKVLREPGQEGLECEIPPQGEEDLTHYRRKRMVDGHLTCLEDYPYTVSVRVKDKPVCTGVLLALSLQHILTVSDCVVGVNISDLSIKLWTPWREHGGRILSVKAVFLHPFSKWYHGVDGNGTDSHHDSDYDEPDGHGNRTYHDNSTYTDNSTYNATTEHDNTTTTTTSSTTANTGSTTTTTTTTTTSTTTTTGSTTTTTGSTTTTAPPRLHLFSYRLALLKMQYPIIPTPRDSGVILPFPRMKIPEFGHLVVTGYGSHPKWGKIDKGYDQLRRVYVKEVNKEECMERRRVVKNISISDNNISISDNNISISDNDNVTHTDLREDKNMSISDNNITISDNISISDNDNDTYTDLLVDEICLEGADNDRLMLCKGDLGAPLVQFGGQNWTGLLLGLSLTADENCANETLNKGFDGELRPAVFLKVSEYRGWLEEVLRREEALMDRMRHFSQKECELWPQIDADLQWLRRRRKRLTTETDLACLEDYPYTVSIRLHGMPWCGGAIIAEDWVLTSAQCFDDVQKEDVTVRMGSVFRDYGGRIVSVIELVKHPQYKPGQPYPAHNLAMLQINVPITPSVRLRPVSLVQPDIARIPAGGENVVTGYGSVKSSLLREGVQQELRRMTVREVARSECQKAYQGVAELQDDHVCMRSVIEGVTLCSGDLGDPAVHFNFYQEDGTLFGLAIHPGDGQCNSSRPAVFTRVWPARPWIDNVLRAGPTQKPAVTTPRGIPRELRCTPGPVPWTLDTRQVKLSAVRRRRMTSDPSQLVCQEDYPYMVSIRIKHKVVASGAIVAKQWALTSADPFSHMFFGDERAGILGDIALQEPSIRMGSLFAKYGGRLLTIIEIKLHPGYQPKEEGFNSSYPSNNLAMVKFNIAYRYSPRMQQVRLPRYNEMLFPPFGRYVVAGYGSKKSGQLEDGNMDLRATEVYPVHIDDCSERLSIGNESIATLSNKSHICMESVNPNISFCSGDIGLPLVHFGDRKWTGTLFGISMYYYEVDCPPGEDHLPLAFADVRAFSNLKWIHTILDNDRYNRTLMYRRWLPSWLFLKRNYAVTGLPSNWRDLMLKKRVG